MEAYVNDFFRNRMGQISRLGRFPRLGPFQNNHNYNIFYIYDYTNPKLVYHPIPVRLTDIRNPMELLACRS